MLWSELGSPECPDTLQYKGKPKQKPPEVEEAREGKQATEGTTGHHGRGGHHGLTVGATTGWPWCPLWWLPGFVSRALRFGVFWCFALGRGFCLFLGLLGLFASFF